MGALCLPRHATHAMPRGKRIVRAAAAACNRDNNYFDRLLQRSFRVPTLMRILDVIWPRQENSFLNANARDV